MIIGITGGVGAGKSTVLNYLEDEYNAVIIQADEAGHMVMMKDGSAYAGLVEYFGKEILDTNGEINRTKLGEYVFGNEALRKKANDIIHPKVREEIEGFIKSEQIKDPDSVIVIEAALLIEAGYRNICDMMWYIYSDYETRAARLKESRNYSDEKIKGMIAGQLSDEEFRKGCDFVIDNSGDFEKTKKQIKEILK